MANHENLAINNPGAQPDLPEPHFDIDVEIPEGFEAAKPAENKAEAKGETPNLPEMLDTRAMAVEDESIRGQSTDMRKNLSELSKQLMEASLKGDNQSIGQLSEKIAGINERFEVLDKRSAALDKKKAELRKFQKEFSQVSDAEIEGFVNGSIHEFAGLSETEVDKALENLKEQEEPEIEVTDDMIMSIEDLPKAEAKKMIEENKLSPERRRSVEVEIAMVGTELRAIEEGALMPNEQTGIIEYKHGLKNLDKKLEAAGVDMDKMAVSGIERFKFGLRSLFNPDLRKTVNQYQERVREFNDAKDRLAMARLEIRNPKEYARLSARRLMRTQMARLNIAANNASMKPMSVGTLKG